MVGGALAAPRWLLILRSFIIRVAEPPTRPACRQSLCRVHLGAVTTRRCRSVYFHYIHKCFFVKKSREENYKLSMNRTRAVLSVVFIGLVLDFEVFRHSIPALKLKVHFHFWNKLERLKNEFLLHKKQVQNRSVVLSITVYKVMKGYETKYHGKNKSPIL